MRGKLMSQDKELSFADCLKRFVSATKNSMKYAILCSEMGLAHFEKTGDLVYCQSFMDAMPKNFIRKTAYLKWLVAFSPAELKGGKLVKDKSETANPFDLDGARQITFWDMLPEKEIKNFAAADALAAVVKLLDGYDNAQRFKPEDEIATSYVANLRRAVKAVPVATADNTVAA
jgi:hypothetical protein